MPGETARWGWVRDWPIDRFRLTGGRNPPGIGAWLFVLGLAAALPVLMFAGLAAHRLASAERQAMLGDMERRAEAAANKVERYLQSLRELAVTLAAAPMLQTGDLGSFYDFAERAMEAGKLGRSVTVVEPDGRMLLNTRRPFGDVLPIAGDVQGVAETLARKAPHIANLFTGAVSRISVFTVWTPVMRGGHVSALVGVTVEPQDLTAVLLEERLPHGFVGVVVDRQGTFVARTLSPEAWVGEAAAPEAKAAHARGPRGAYQLTNREGIAVTAYHVRLQSNGWTVALGVPTQQIEAPAAATTRFLLALGLASLVTAGALAFLVGRHMSRQVASVANAAMAVGDNREPILVPFSVRELDEVSGALLAARGLIDAREAELRESEADFRGYFENAAVGTAQIDAQGRFRRVNQRYCEITGYSRQELLAGMGPLDLDHPEDHDVDSERIARFFQGLLPIYQAEKRYVHKDGHTVWVRVSATNVRNDHENRPRYTAGVIEDITERKRAEEHAATLMREVNHRAKNLLAVVQAVALQTAREDSPKVFAEQFSERMAGLAASHDLLVRSEWQGVDAGDLVRSQLAHFSGLIGTRVVLLGPPVQLRPSAAQAIGMAIHELGTNAGKYGALSNGAGTISIEWETLENGIEQQLLMRWSERGGPPPSPSQRHGYGHRVITEMIEYALDAEVSLEFPATGLVWQMTAPASGNWEFREPHGDVAKVEPCAC